MAPPRPVSNPSAMCNGLATNLLPTMRPPLRLKLSARRPNEPCIRKQSTTYNNHPCGSCAKKHNRQPTTAITWHLRPNKRIYSHLRTKQPPSSLTRKTNYQRMAQQPRCLLASRAYHGARAGHDLGGLSLGADLAQAGPLSELLAGVHLHGAKGSRTGAIVGNNAFGIKVHTPYGRFRSGLTFPQTHTAGQRMCKCERRGRTGCRAQQKHSMYCLCKISLQET